MSIDLVPSPEELPDVLPTERLLVNGMAIPELRKELSPHRELAQRPGDLVRLALTAHWPIWACAWVPSRRSRSSSSWGRCTRDFAILMHESAHKLLFTKQARQRLRGEVVHRLSAMVPISIYRRAHFAHHKEEFGPEEPDMAFYSGYPCEPADLRRRLLRDAVVSRATRTSSPSSWRRRNNRVGPSPRRSSPCRPCCSDCSGGAPARVVVSALLVAAVDDQWRVLNRLRAIAEHGGMLKSDDRRLTTHNVRQHLLARSGSFLTHRVAPGPPRRHGRAVAQPPGLPPRTAVGRLRDGRHHVRELLPALAQRDRVGALVEVLNSVPRRCTCRH